MLEATTPSGAVRRLRLRLSQHFRTDARAFGGVFRIVIRPYHLRVLGREHRAAHEYLGIGRLIAQQRDGLFHPSNRRGHKGRKPNELNTVFLHAINHRLRIDIASQVENCIPVVFQQHLHDILAYRECRRFRWIPATPPVPARPRLQTTRAP